jgi:TP901 family phage tail tape measure protein
MAQSVNYIIRLKDRFSRQLSKIYKNLQTVRKSLMSFSKDMFLKAGIIAGVSLKTFTNFEKALFNVAKTANIDVGPSLDLFGSKIRNISEELGISSKNLANFAAVSAQLGVKGEENLLKFAEVLGKLEKTTNIIGDEGAAQLARLINIVGASTNEVDKFASAIVALGNNSAATESEILGFATDLASRSAIFGLSGQDALGLAAAFKSIGLQSELASSAVGRNLGNISKAISLGGEELKILTAVTGESAQSLKKSFERDALGVLLKFGAGLDKLSAKGIDLSVVLQQFGADGVRDATVLGTLAKRADLVRRSISLANTSFAENVAINKEFETRMKSVGAQMDRLRVQFFNLIIEGVNEFKNEIKAAINLVGKFFRFLKENKELVKFGLILTTISLAAASLAGIIALLLTPMGQIAAVIASISSAVMFLVKGLESFMGKFKLSNPFVAMLQKRLSSQGHSISQSQKSNVDISGMIKVNAGQGAQIEKATMFNPNIGLNVATAGG